MASTKGAIACLSGNYWFLGGIWMSDEGLVAEKRMTVEVSASEYVFPPLKKSL